MVYRSCGTVTTSSYKLVPGTQNPKWWPKFLPSFEKHYCDLTNTRSTPNVCVEWPLEVGGRAEGQVVWVNTVCDGGGLVPLKWQAEIYRHKGVHAGSIVEDYNPAKDAPPSTGKGGSTDGLGSFGADPHAPPPSS
jgi:hypothetical protein